MRGWLSSMGGLAVLASLAGCASAGVQTTTAEKPATTTAASPERSAPVNSSVPRAQSSSRSEPAESPATSSCGGEVHAGSHTSCQFAQSVAQHFQTLQKSAGFPPGIVKAYSPVTRRGYSLRCVLVANGATAECTTGNAVVSFPAKGAEATSPSPSESSSSSGGEGEDEVGSSSHTGDAKFCEEHTCIGSFTTEGGTVVKCTDGTYSHAGGISGACSHHGGEE